MNRVVFAAALMTAGLGLAGCGFTPLYGAPGVTAQLTAIQVTTPPGRTGQLIREHLDDALARDKGAAPRYRMDLQLSETRYPRGVRVDNESGKCVTVGDFIPPMTRAKFLQNPLAQYNALIESLRRYDRHLASAVLPSGLSRSGALALHHRLGPCALSKWEEHQEKTTIALFQRANGLF